MYCEIREKELKRRGNNFAPVDPALPGSALFPLLWCIHEMALLNPLMVSMIVQKARVLLLHGWYCHSE